MYLYQGGIFMKLSFTMVPGHINFAHTISIRETCAISVRVFMTLQTYMIIPAEDVCLVCVQSSLVASAFQGG